MQTKMNNLTYYSHLDSVNALPNSNEKLISLSGLPQSLENYDMLFDQDRHNKYSDE